MAKSKKKSGGIRLIKKANKLVESRYKFDIWESRVFFMMLSQIKRDDEEFKVYRIWYKDLIKTFGLTSAQSYHFLRQAASGLMKKVFYVTNVGEGGHKRVTEYHIIRKANYLKKGEDGGQGQEYIDITIDEEMKPLLLQLGNNFRGEKGEHFTAYDIRNIKKLGVYHTRIYKLLKQYQKIGHRTLVVEDIKRMFVIEEEYPRFANFYQKVVKPSINRINKYTDLKITSVEKIKQGRKIELLKFWFRLKTKEEKLEARGVTIEEPKKEITAETLLEKYKKDIVERFGVTPSKFINDCTQNNYSDEDIKQAIEVTNRAKYNQEITKSVPGFFMNALKGSYTDEKIERKKKSSPGILSESELKNLKEELEKKKQELKEKRERNEKIRELVKKDKTITDNAIKELEKNPLAKKRIEQLKAKKKILEIEDYRKDSVLRDMVINKIIEMNKEVFHSS